MSSSNEASFRRQKINRNEKKILYAGIKSIGVQSAILFIYKSFAQILHSLPFLNVLELLKRFCCFCIILLS